MKVKLKKTKNPLLRVILADGKHIGFARKWSAENYAHYVTIGGKRERADGLSDVTNVARKMLGVL